MTRIPSPRVSTPAPDSDYDSLLPPLILSRRRFIAGSMATGFALAAGPVCASTAIHTDDAGLTTGMVQIPSGDEMVPAFRAMPQNMQNMPVILVVQEIFGVHEYIKDVCRRLAKAGYMAIAPELYFRQGDAATYTDVNTLIKDIVSKVDDTQVLSDLDATVTWAGEQDGNIDALGITGFCWGGRIAWLFAAHNDKVKAAVAWYGRLTGASGSPQPLDIAGQLHGPVLGLYGGQDNGIPQSDIDAMQAALARGNEAAQASTFVVYPDASHAFHADYRPSYQAEAAQDGWQRALAWFGEHLS